MQVLLMDVKLGYQCLIIAVVKEVSDWTSHLRGWKQNRSNCYWIKKYIQPLSTHALKLLQFNLCHVSNAKKRSKPIHDINVPGWYKSKAVYHVLPLSYHVVVTNTSHKRNNGLSAIEPRMR